ncbi:LuxR C-terminal-related transcriptional regulator [Lentzea sp. BCCO 10_0061]|uniref:LuxR C-terminal-related transcriptional regulator n=1 Tax=Lentzea sokolovensis TaxID=3095429 RepID=A0ABU4URP5_9PSEU|nr:LuxR C-terminal-related transcriptional regulator [Lentzea sp. BCCO 10_0061]MDX8141380.1 LuxR C-terminal-related transcriptional regulator [Lentzea sp. BCCO 10_0061]
MNVPRIVDTTSCGASTGGAHGESADRVSVAWLSTGPDPAAALQHALRASPELKLLAEMDRPIADVVLAVADVVDDLFVDALAAIPEEATNPEQRIVLMSGPLQRRHLPRVFGAGVVCALAYRDATPRRIARAIFACRNGQAVLPGQLTRWLLDEIRFVQRDLLVSQDLAPGGLTTREVEVLRYVAQGDETAEVAAKLSYSERTIKKILQDLLTRLRLQNRAHAVSYAMRVGAI